MTGHRHLRDDELFGFADSYMREAFPNPQREGCPSNAELRRVAEDPAHGRRDVLDHISTCSPCYTSYAEILQEQRTRARASSLARTADWWHSKRTRLVFASVAIVLVVAGALLMSRSRPRSAVPVTLAIDLSQSSPSRGAGPSPTRKEIRVPQDLVDLTLQFPVGSDEGRYQVSLRSGPSTAWSEAIDAHFIDHVLTLRARVDFRSVATGQYDLTVESASGLRFVQPIRLVSSTHSGVSKSSWRERMLTATAARFFSIRLRNRDAQTDSPHANNNDAGQLIAEADHLAWLGNWPAAAPLYARAESIATTNRDAKAAAHARIGRIRGQAESKPFAQVSEMLALELENPIVKNDPRLRLFALTAKGYTDLDVNLASCRAAWEQALQTARELHDPQWESRAQGELGIVTFLEGDRSKAEKLVGAALLNAMQNGDVAAQVRLMSMIGNGLADVGRFDEALEFFRRAVKLASETKDIGFPFMAYEGEARCLTALGKPQQSNEVLETVLNEAKKAEKRGHEAQILILLGELSLSSNKIGEAEKYLRDGGELSRMSQFPRMEDEAMYQLASIYRNEGKLKETEDALREGIQASRAVGDRYYLPRDLSALAEIKMLSGNYREADALWEQATDVLDGMLVNSPSWNARSTMIAAASEIFLRHFELAAKQNDIKKAFRIVERARGRSVADLLWRHPSDVATNTSADRQISLLQVQLLQTESQKAREKLLSALFEAEQRRSFAVNSRAKSQPVREPVSLAVLQRALGRNELLLEYVLSDPNSFCLAVTRGRARLVSLPTSAGRIELLVRDYLSRIREKRPAPNVVRQLYSLLLGPVVGVSTRPRIVIIPDGILHLLPFDALTDETGKYALETSVITYTPSATVLQMLRTRHRHSSELPFLGVGDVTYEPPVAGAADLRKATLGSTTRGVADLAAANFEPLPASRNEVLAAAEVFGSRSTVLLGPKATEAAFKREPLGRFGVIHLAVHGIADSKYPERAALVLGRDAKSADDGLLQAREIADLTLNADLVTLSACDTGIGKLQGEEGVASLQNAFLMAGARATLATLWTADDTFTAALIKQFYRNLSAGMDKGSALRKAKLELISKFGDKAQPYYWAAFVLDGDANSAGFQKQ